MAGKGKEQKTSWKDGGIKEEEKGRLMPFRIIRAADEVI